MLVKVTVEGSSFREARQELNVLLNGIAGKKVVRFYVVDTYAVA